MLNPRCSESGCRRTDWHGRLDLHPLFLHSRSFVKGNETGNHFCLPKKLVHHRRPAHLPLLLVHAARYRLSCTSTFETGRSYSSSYRWMEHHSLRLVLCCRCPYCRSCLSMVCFLSRVVMVPAEVDSDRSLCTRKNTPLPAKIGFTLSTFIFGFTGLQEFQRSALGSCSDERHSLQFQESKGGQNR